MNQMGRLRGAMDVAALKVLREIVPKILGTLKRELISMIQEKFGAMDEVAQLRARIVVHRDFAAC